MMKKIICLLAIVMNLIACGEKEIVIPPDVLDRKKLADVLTELHLAQSIESSRTFSDSSQAGLDDLTAFIYKKHHMNEDDFRRSLQFYSNHPEILQQVYDTVIANLSKMQGVVESEQ